jgi:hypothetical protein
VAGEVWAPELEDVGQLIPSRTRPSDPADDSELGTFTPDTTPTDSQAQGHIDNAVNAVLAEVGTLPLTPAAAVTLTQGAAKTAAAWQAAADIELAYFARPGDVQMWAQYTARATAALAALRAAMEQYGAGDIAVDPVWAMPQPVSWGDDLLL